VDLKISEETQQQVLGRQLHPHLDGVSLENFWSPEDTGMSSGVLVTEVEAESRAFAFGLRAGDVVVGLNRANVRDISQLRDTLQSVKKRVTLNIYRNGRFGDIFIR
jgi:S1-C subfamily serine protease